MSQASKMVIDNETWQAIREGRIDLRHASKELRTAAVEIGFGVSRKRGFLDRLLHGDHQDSHDIAKLKMAEILANVDMLNGESRKTAEKRGEWAQKTRLKTVPQHYQLLTANRYGHSYSDGSGNILHYNTNGSRMSARQEYDYLNRIYGSGE